LAQILTGSKQKCFWSLSSSNIVSFEGLLKGSCLLPFIWSFEIYEDYKEPCGLPIPSKSVMLDIFKDFTI
jgi:hypothetical protein